MIKGWTRPRFDAEQEAAYARHMHGRMVVLSRAAMIIGMLAFVLIGYWDWLLYPEATRTTFVIRAAVTAYLGIVAILIPWTTGNPKYWLMAMLLTYEGVAIALNLIFAHLPNGFIIGPGALILGMIFLPALTIRFRDTVVVLSAYMVTSLVIMMYYQASAFAFINMMIWVGGGVTFALGLSYILDGVNRQAFLLEQNLTSEKERSEALLLNILPAEIAARLKAEEEPLADHHDNVSVLFADLAGFTGLSQKLAPGELVTLLNDLFSRFDRLAEDHGAEKIKTIGDAYMVATGLNGSVANHAERIASLALGMQAAFRAFCAENGLDLKIRIGVHSGAVVAGVIGKQKFSYDLWGDTVNVASRMESEGIDGEIQVSEETCRLLGEHHRLTPRGRIDIKGHEPRETFILGTAN